MSPKRTPPSVSLARFTVCVRRLIYSSCDFLHLFERNQLCGKQYLSRLEQFFSLCATHCFEHHLCSFVDSLARHVAPPQALVTTEAVKLRPIGMLTVDHIGSTAVGLLAGIAP